MADIYDIVIIGGGPAGLTASLYACRAKLKVLLLEKIACGGQILLTDTIENFPGFPEGIAGPELAQWMLKQAERFGLEVKIFEVAKISPKKDEKDHFTIELLSGPVVRANALIISTGARWNNLNVPGEKELTGRGVSYCATCDAPFFKNKDVAVVGGGDTALQDALFLTKFANKVTLIHRRDRLRAAKILQDRVVANHKIELSLNSICTKILGTNKVEGVGIKDVVTGAEKTIRVDGVFVFIGMTPNSMITKDLVKLDQSGYILCDDTMGTSCPGIFACGDVRSKPFRQVVTAASDGAVAAFGAQGYIERSKGIEYPPRAR
jgi:thioredoxin reductase (NADPH)